MDTGPRTVSARNWRIQSRVRMPCCVRIGANALDKSAFLLSHCTSVTYLEIMRSDVKYRAVDLQWKKGRIYKNVRNVATVEKSVLNKLYE